MKILLNVAGFIFALFMFYCFFMWAITPEKDENGDYYSVEYVLFGIE